MNYTNYFENINLDAIENTINEAISNLNNAKNINIHSKFNDNSWISDSKNKLLSSLDNNETEIADLVARLENFKRALSIAREIKNIQNQMKNTTDYINLTSSASTIQSKISQFVEIINNC